MSEYKIPWNRDWDWDYYRHWDDSKSIEWNYQNIYEAALEEGYNQALIDKKAFPKGSPISHTNPVNEMDDIKKAEAGISKKQAELEKRRKALEKKEAALKAKEKEIEDTLKKVKEDEARLKEVEKSLLEKELKLNELEFRKSDVNELMG